MPRLAFSSVSLPLMVALCGACSVGSTTNQMPDIENGDPAAGSPGGAQPGAGTSTTDDGGGASSSSSSDDAGTPPPPPPAVDAATPPAGPAVTSFTLLDADADQPIAGYDPIADGATITLANLPSQNITIRANVAENGSVVGSVSFDLDGTVAFHVEQAAPYALAGDNAGDFLALTPPLAVGSHTLKAGPFSEANAMGTAGISKTVTFSVQ